MPVEVLIAANKHWAINYFLSPLQDSLARRLRNDKNGMAFYLESVTPPRS